ncbi:hypothetical protein BZG36_05545 [Bifiguratus adelaidae]|uniref:ABC transporter domain-containing protein n=1 Tax=Bifiguratus adelaidae TaxID=1938954 RepID=A0A261XSS7_9FUNG|nr:hypothetical protein BZG36_05545 [Bifiguratus adelaidae]
MVSIERIKEYIDVSSPYSDSEPDGEQLENWPSAGMIKFCNCSTRYGDGPTILHKVSLTINAGKKVGIVGRTGSGKSTLALALLRLVEASADDLSSTTMTEKVDSARADPTIGHIEI